MELLSVEDLCVTLLVGRLASGGQLDLFGMGFEDLRTDLPGYNVAGDTVFSGKTAKLLRSAHGSLQNFLEKRREFSVVGGR